MQFSKKWTASLLAMALPYFAQAEAFKGGFLTSGQEKAVFFIGLLIFFGTIFLFYKFLTRASKGGQNSLLPFVVILVLLLMVLFTVLSA